MDSLYIKGVQVCHQNTHRPRLIQDEVVALSSNLSIEE